MSQYHQPHPPPPPRVHGQGNPFIPPPTQIQQIHQPMNYAPQYPPQQNSQPNSQQQPQQVLLGYLNGNEGSVSKAVYGPPGAEFDSLGNVYFQRDRYFKEYVGPYKDYKGRITQPPKQRRPLIGSCWGPTWLDWCLGR